MKGAPRLRLSILDPLGRPLEAARCQVDWNGPSPDQGLDFDRFIQGSNSWQGITDHRGQFDTAGLLSGSSYSNRVDGEGFLPWEEAEFLALDPADPIVLTVRLQAAAVLAGKVEFADGGLDYTLLLFKGFFQPTNNPLSDSANRLLKRPLRLPASGLTLDLSLSDR